VEIQASPESGNCRRATAQIDGTDWTIPAKRYKTKLDHVRVARRSRRSASHFASIASPLLSATSSNILTTSERMARTSIKERARNRVLSDTELRALWAAHRVPVPATT